MLNIVEYLVRGQSNGESDFLCPGQVATLPHFMKNKDVAVEAVRSHYCVYMYIIESIDSISRDERDVPLTQYITNA